MIIELLPNLSFKCNCKWNMLGFLMIDLRKNCFTTIHNESFDRFQLPNSTIRFL